MGSVHNIRKAYLPNVNCLRGSRPRILNTEMQQSCVLQLMRGRANTAPDVARHVEQDFGISVSTQTVRHALQRCGLSAQQKKKKPQLFDKNVKVRLDFARVNP
jgi:transposase